jgi:hypothetical protein
MMFVNRIHVLGAQGIPSLLPAVPACFASHHGDHHAHLQLVPTWWQLPDMASTLSKNPAVDILSNDQGPSTAGKGLQDG